MNTVLYYRDLHRIPELSGKEYRTAAYIERVLYQEGYSPVRIGDTGIFADLVQSDDRPWLLFRADMDALPIHENSGVIYKSENPGIMHACGHDAHCAMLLEVARQLKKEILRYNIRFVFQPAEETTQGASMMINRGVIPKRLHACFAIHVWPGLKQGGLFTRSGALMASNDMFTIRVVGKNAHCGQRQLGADALQTAVAIASSFPEIEALTSDERTIVFCGSIHSGNGHNIVPDSAALSGTIRAYSEEDRDKTKVILEGKIQSIAQMYGTNAILNWDSGCPAVTNDATLVEQIQLYEKSVDTAIEPTLAAEDFAYYQKKSPGLMVWLGVGNTAPLHNNQFVIPEEVLHRGVSFWYNIATHNWC